MKKLEPLFPIAELRAVQDHLLTLLRGLAPEDWARPTACPGWTVADLVAHLLDSDLRRLSVLRDGHAPPPPHAIDGYDSLLAYLNQLNATWVTAARRLSPRILIELTARVSAEMVAFVAAIDPGAPAGFAVAWAGEERSPHWLDVARELTEKWLHQQQIREAVGQPLLTARRYLHPVLETFLRAVPHTYRRVAADDGTTVALIVEGEAGGAWTLRREGAGWTLYRGPAPAPAPAATVRMDQDAAWRLLGSRRRPPAVVEAVTVEGDRALGGVLLEAVAVMA